MFHNKTAGPPRTTPRCERCDAKFRGKGDWNMTAVAGVIKGVLCPGCQTPAENAEAEINEATTDYDMTADGRLIGRPKVGTR